MSFSSRLVSRAPPHDPARLQIRFPAAPSLPAVALSGERTCSSPSRTDTAPCAGHHLTLSCPGCQLGWLPASVWSCQPPLLSLPRAPPRGSRQTRCSPPTCWVGSVAKRQAALKEQPGSRTRNSSVSLRQNTHPHLLALRGRENVPTSLKLKVVY